MSSPSRPAERPARDWWVILGMTITAISAAVSSFSGLQSLAVATGWPEPLSFLLPCTIDAYALTATRVWLSAATRSARARRFARWNAVMAIGLSLVGNAVWHLIAAKVLTVTWPIVVLVGAVPPAVLGLLSHLAVLRGQVDPAPVTVPRPVEPGSVPLPAVHRSVVMQSAEPPRPDQDEPEDDPQDEDDAADQPRTELSLPQVEPSQEDELLTAARRADVAHRAEHRKPITRDELRKVLRVSTERATTLLRELKESTSNYR
jgi:uncharacterized protein DUF2637